MDVQKLLGDFLGTQKRETTGTPASRQGQPSGSLTDQLGGLLQGQAGSALSGALAGGLASHLFGGKRKRGLGGSMGRLGGAALIAGLAYKAYQSYQAKNGQPASEGSPAPMPSQGGDTPPVEGTKFLPRGEEDVHAALMLSAMISAAKADGYIDPQEEQAIFGKLDDLDLSAEEKGYVMDEMRHPLSAAELAAKARTREAAMDIYTASYLAIDPDHPAEKDYLARLARHLNLPDELISHIHATADQASA